MAKARRQRNIQPWVDQLHALLHAERLRQLPPVQATFGQQAVPCCNFTPPATLASKLAEATHATFLQHPDAAILTSFPA